MSEVEKEQGDGLLETNGLQPKIKTDPCQNSSKVKIENESDLRNGTSDTVRNELDGNFSHDVKKGVRALTEVLKETLVPSSQTLGSIPGWEKAKQEKECETDTKRGVMVGSSEIKLENWEAKQISCIDVGVPLKQENVKQEKGAASEVELAFTEHEPFLQDSVVELLKESGYAEKATEENIRHIIGWLANGILPTEVELYALFNSSSDGDELSSTAPHEKGPQECNGKIGSCPRVNTTKSSPSPVSQRTNEQSVTRGRGRPRKVPSKKQESKAESACQSKAGSPGVNPLDLSPIKSCPLLSEPDVELSSTVPHENGPQECNGKIDSCPHVNTKKSSPSPVSQRTNEQSVTGGRGRPRKVPSKKQKSMAESSGQSESASPGSSPPRLSPVKSSYLSEPDVEVLPSLQRYTLRKKPKMNFAEERGSSPEDFNSDDSDDWTPDKESEVSLQTSRTSARHDTDGTLSRMRKTATIDNALVGGDLSRGNCNKRKRESSNNTEEFSKNKVFVISSRNTTVKVSKDICDKILQKEKSILRKSDKQTNEMCESLKTKGDNCEGEGNVKIKKPKLTPFACKKTLSAKEVQSPTTNYTTDIQTTTNVNGEEVITKTETKIVTRTEIIKKVSAADRAETAEELMAAKPPSTSTTSTTSMSSGASKSDKSSHSLNDVHPCTKCLLAYTSRPLLQRHMFRLHYNEYVRLRAENYWEGVTMAQTYHLQVTHPKK